MDEKKVVLFIFEGKSDQTALQTILAKIIWSKQVQIALTQGDVTTKNDLDDTRSKILQYLKSKIIEALNIYSFDIDDVCSIIHVIDTDGGYIPDSFVYKKDDSETFDYQLDGIYSKNPEIVIDRNNQKKKRTKLLLDTTYIKFDVNAELICIPYRIYFFSRNREHALQDINLYTDEEKIAAAKKFSSSYSQNIDGFIKLIKSNDIKVNGTFEETWNYIQIENHSLERGSNFYLAVEDFLIPNFNHKETGKFLDSRM